MSIDMNDTVAWRDEHHKLTSAIQIPIDIMSFELNLQKESKNKTDVVWWNFTNKTARIKQIYLPALNVMLREYCHQTLTSWRHEALSVVVVVVKHQFVIDLEHYQH